MATLVLSTVGRIVAGPIGGAIGAIVGQQIDYRIFAPKARHGPRLGELSVQTSSYGSAIPKIFGRMRVAGTVIWATDLRETKTKKGGGKGKPKTVEYSYSAHFAVALSGRPIASVRRIWADGKLLRGEAGDFKTETGFRLHLGSEAQAPDPLIASVEGAAPAYRGIAYAVFEDFQLGDYGNRIPSLTFEVEAEPGPVSFGTIAAALSDGEIGAGETPSLAGYAASGDSVRGAIEALGEAAPLSLAETAAGPVLRSAPAEAEAELGEAGASPDGEPGRTEVLRASAAVAPSEVAIAYHDVERDYQTGLQRAARSGGAALQADRRAVAGALSAAAARTLAEARLEALWAGRSIAKVRLGWRSAALRPGSAVRLAGQSGLWRVARWSLERMAVALELVKLPPPPVASGGTGTDPGRPVGHPDLPHGPTRLLLLDLPFGFDRPALRPQLVAAAAGAGAGWRPPALIASYDGGASWEPAGRVGAGAVIGTAVTPLAASGAALVDEVNVLEVELEGDAWLESRDDAALADGANLAALGSEILQFGRAEPLGAGRFRLSRLLRGRRGTEWAAGHVPGEPFLLLDEDELLVIEPPLSRAGGEARLLASGLEGEAEAAVAIAGEALRPPSPVHFRADEGQDGAILLRWVRRSRTGWTWGEGETPLGEAREAYRLTLSGPGGTKSLTLAQPAFAYTAAGQAADGLGRPLAASVVQIGDAAASRPATIAID